MPFHLHKNGVSVRIRLTPAARKTAFQGFADEAGGADAGRLLKISVNAVPEDGKANRALIEFLAKEWGLPKSALGLIAGDTSRQKTILVQSDDPPALLARLCALYSK
ncbi:MAG: DUF167 domain-containing protein [Alphaproteobacteria bacterium]|nr:DUF167 domain-containing protein [Alphaproteobacteria bacterium]